MRQKLAEHGVQIAPLYSKIPSTFTYLSIIQPSLQDALSEFKDTFQTDKIQGGKQGTLKGVVSK